jgi:DeoR/GlpR family transcriptional regulator of sugar metabolism
VDRRSRQQLIIERLEKKGQIRISELTDQIGVSEMTIRRDLESLERDGLLKRVHGGATRAISRSYEPMYSVRARLELEAKEALGRTAAEIVRDGDTCVVDGGTTGLAIARALHGRQNLTVCTTSLRVAQELADEPGIRLMIIGGIVRQGEHSIVGDLADCAFENLRFDVLFLTASGVHLEEGITEWNLDDARVKRSAIRSARRCVLTADATKIGKVAFSRVCGFDAIHAFVTDRRMPAEVGQKLAQWDIDVSIASAPREIGLAEGGGHQ